MGRKVKCQKLIIEWLVFIVRNQKKFLGYKQFIRNFRGGLDFFLVIEDAYYEKYFFFAFVELSQCIFFLWDIPDTENSLLENE